MGACTSNKREKTIKMNENMMEKSAILDYNMKETKKDKANNNQKINSEETENIIQENNDKTNIITINQNINNNTTNNNNLRSQNNKDKKRNSVNHYLICPECSIRSPHIEKLYYDNKSKDFLVKYTCICNDSNSPKEIPLINILSNKEPLNNCNIHSNSQLINYCKTCRRAICSICKEEQHNNHDLEFDIINKPISKDDANKLLETIKEKEEQFNKEINQNEEKMETGIDNKIQKLNQEKIDYKKQLENYKENNQKTFSFLKNLYSRYINNFGNKNENNNNNINNDQIKNNDIMLTNHIHNFAIKNNDISKFNTNLDEIINQYNDKKELQLNYNYGFPNKNEIPSERDRNNIPQDKDNFDKQKEKGFSCSKILKGHTEKIVAIIELSSGKLASGSYDKTIRIWDLNNLEKEEMILKEKGRIFCLLEFEKNKILSGTSDNSIILWDIDLPNENNIFNFTGHELWVNCLVKCNENYFASASNDTKIKIWDYYNKECITTFTGHIDCVLALIILKNKNLCSGGADLTIKLWDWEEKTCLSTLKGHEKWVKCLFELNNGIILSGSDDNSIKIWENYINIKTLKKHTHSVRTICQINNNYFASGSFDCTIKIWEINSWKCIQTLVGHNSNIINLISIKNNINNDNFSDSIASCSNDKTIRIWEGII